MSLPIHTAETIENSAIAYKYKISHQSRIIYTAVLLAVVGTFAALPFIKVQISVRSISGSLQSSVEKQELRVPINGRVLNVLVKENQKLKQGDTILRIDLTVPKVQNELLQTRLSQLNENLADVNRVVNAIKQNEYNPIQLSLQTDQYRAAWQQYMQELKNSYIAKEQAVRTFKRYQALYREQVLTAAEFEKYKFELEQAISNFALVSRTYKSRWQVEATEYRKELNGLQNQQTNLDEQKEQSVLRAPVNGSIQGLVGLHQGSYIFANQKIAEISPDSNLVAFCIIRPSDVGLIAEGQDVRIQVDAFNYNQWGLLTGKVIDISDDVFVVNNQPFFRVKCQLDKNYLQLKGGYKGYLKKGMNFTARFAVTKRSLFQLLYDKVDNWVNPNQVPNS